MNYSPNYSMPEPGYGDLADIDAVNDAIEMIDHLTHGNRTMFAGGWEAEETYSKGKYVVKTNPTNLEADFYRCKEDNTTGAWDASKWEHKTIGEVLEELATSAGAQELDDLSDVEITSPSEGQILRRDANGDWVNTDMPDASVTKTAEGNPIEITDGASAPLVKCVSAITGSQDLHGYDKPWVGGAGKNKIPVLLSEVKSNNTDGTWDGDTYSYSGVTFKVDSNSEGYVTKITVNASPSSSAFSFYLQRVTTVYTVDMILNGCPSGGGDATYDLRISGGYRDIGSGVTIPANTSFNIFWIVIRSGITVSNLVFEPMIRLATESDSTFAPYSNICPITAYTEGEIEVSDGDGNTTTHTTTYPSAIYRGSEDVVNGEVTEEWKVVDLGSLTWTKKTANVETPYFRTEVSNYKHISGQANTLCSNYENTAIGATGSDIGYFFTSGLELRVRDIQDYTDATAFATAMSGVMLAYELATPTTSSVTPTNLPIHTLSGYTHIESSTGEMEVEYIAKAFSPITEIVDSQISALQKMMELMLTSAREATMTASANYTTGTLIVACGALYKATTAISSGTSLVVGTNITPTTIAAELAALA